LELPEANGSHKSSTKLPNQSPSRSPKQELRPKQVGQIADENPFDHQNKVPQNELVGLPNQGLSFCASETVEQPNPNFQIAHSKPFGPDGQND
jgi:hypothetical protein